MRIVIGADIVPTKSNIDLFSLGNTTELVGEELEQIIKQADFSIFNLEVPLTDNQSPILKCGEAMIAPTKCVRALKELKINLLTLCNNHILDQGRQGLLSTIRVLNENGIDHVGVGKSPVEAAAPYIFKCNDKTIGVYACTEHEFSIVSSNNIGANPIDLFESFDHVQQLKNQCDYVIVLYHGGKELYRYPSPFLQKVCRRFVDKGANLVVCQHSHCIGAEEKYKDSSIVYGQGNFIFDDSDSECWKTGLLIQIEDDFDINYIPVQKSGNVVRIADKKTEHIILENFQKRSNEIKDPNRIEMLYNEFAYNYLTDLLSVSSGKRFGLFVRILNKIVGNNRIIELIVRKNYSQNKYLTLLNRVECEAYHELFVAALKEEIRRKSK